MVGVFFMCTSCLSKGTKAKPSASQAVSTTVTEHKIANGKTVTIYSKS